MKTINETLKEIENNVKINEQLKFYGLTSNDVGILIVDRVKETFTNLTVGNEPIQVWITKQTLEIESVFTDFTHPLIDNDDIIKERVKKIEKESIYNTRGLR